MAMVGALPDALVGFMPSSASWAAASWFAFVWSIIFCALMKIRSVRREWA